jgi:electron transfer flavoprotein beta subunit
MVERLPPVAGSGPVVACLSPADLRPAVDPLTGQVSIDPGRAELSASDSAALEHALRAGEQWAATVVAVAAGPASIEPALRQALAVGAEVARLEWPEESGGRGITGRELAGDPQRLAAALAGFISGLGPPRLVVCGDRSPRHGVGAVPALLAHHLGAAQALGLVSLSVEGDTVVGERRLDAGWRERLRLRSPAVCSVEAAGVRLRRAALPAALDAAQAAVPVEAATDDGPTRIRYGPPRPYRPRTRVVDAPSGGTRDRILTLTGALSAHEPPRIVGPVDAVGAADELLDFLARHGYLEAAQKPG